MRGFLLDNTSMYAMGQTKKFNFTLTTTCSPTLKKNQVYMVQFKICADGGVLDIDPCVDTDLTVDKSPNVVVRTNKLRK